MSEKGNEVEATNGADGGSAFPSQPMLNAAGFPNSTFDPGMSLRDWFAGKALESMAPGWFQNGEGHDGIANLAYSQADAMLAERMIKRPGPAPQKPLDK